MPGFGEYLVNSYLNWRMYVWYHVMNFLKIKRSMPEVSQDSNSNCSCGICCCNLSHYRKKYPIFILHQIPESALGIFRHHKTLLNHLTFCFSFSLQHLFCLFCSLWMLPQLWCPYVPIHLQANPCLVQSHLQQVSFLCRWNSCFPGSFVQDSTLSVSVEYCF